MALKHYLTLGFISLFCFQTYSQSDLYLYLSQIPGAEIRDLKTGKDFKEKYEVFIDQYIDHSNPDHGTFRQRFFVCHDSLQNPVVFVTEGYQAGYAAWDMYRSEISTILDANEIVIEHRYFAQSAPDSIEWEYLTVANAAADHHHILELMKPYYDGKWVSTGISKGGQTAMFYRTFYPDDVDATVGYVCPLNFSDEDLRAYKFLDEVGDPICRQKIHDFQKALLESKSECLPIFEKIMEEKELTFSRGWEAGYEFLVLEYSFAYWQWGTDCNTIPGPHSKAEDMLNHLTKVTGFDWGTEEGVEGLLPFFYQAITEIGMYGYDFSEFDGLITALDDNTFDFTCPEGIDCEFNPATMEKVDQFVRHEAENMMFIYGEWDAWSSTAVQWSGNPGVVKVINPDGSHGSRILNLPESKKQYVFSVLEEWLDVDINPEF